MILRIPEDVDKINPDTYYAILDADTLDCGGLALGEVLVEKHEKYDWGATKVYTEIQSNQVMDIVEAL